MTKKIRLFVCLFAVGICSLPFTFNFIFAAESSPKLRQKTFEVVWRTVNEQYFDPDFGGVDWAAVRQRYAPQVLNTKSNEELHELLNNMLGEIHISHLGIIKSEDLEQFTELSVITGLALRDIDNEIIITRVLEGSSAEKAGLRAGFTIKEVDHAAVVNSEDADVALGGENQKHRVGFLADGSVLREAVLDNQLPPSNKLVRVKLTWESAWYALLESKRLKGGIGYIHFTNFIVPLKKKLLTTLETMKDAPGIIIDLRGNSGGSPEVSLAMAGMLLGKETQLAITRTRKGDNYSYKTKPQKNPYLGPIAILLDEQSGSESEQIAAGLQEVGRAIVIGKTSKGKVMDGIGVELPTGAILIYPAGQGRTPKGVVIEGRGVVPNIKVTLTRAELLKGNDSQLEMAIEYVQQQKH
jgi:carboxyl-terminal processing protease